MDPHSFIARAEAQRWIGIAEKLLMSHDLVGSKTFAIRARDSDPSLEAAEQILAIADTLLAAEKRVVGNNGAQQPDFYAILQLVRFVQDTDQIADQYRRLAVVLNPHHNRFPYSNQAFQLVNEAWTLLSNPMRKSIYDSELDFAPQQQMNNLGFNIEQQHHHQQHQQHQQHQHQQQQQHNFFSNNQELPESPQTFQTRLQKSHQHQNQNQHQQLQQHNFLSPPNPTVREQEHLFQHREQEQLFQPQVTSPPRQQTRPSPQPRTPIHSPSPAASQPPFSWQQEHLQQQLQQKQIKQEQQHQHIKQDQQLQQQQMKQEQLKKQQLRDEQVKQQKLQQEQLKQQQIQQEHLKQQQLQEEKLKKQRMHEEQLKQQRMQEEQLKQQRMQEEQLKQQRMHEEQLKQQRIQEEQMKQQRMQEEQLKLQQLQQERLKQQHLQQEQLKQQQLQQEQLKQHQLQQEQLKQQQLQQEQLKQQQMLQEQQKQQPMQQEQHRQQQESLQQNAAPVQHPSQVNSTDGARGEETETGAEVEVETETADENVDDSPTFWTSCPYCFYMYEYPKLYADCTLRCDNCKRAFQAVRISSPPPTIEGQDAYFCCWGFIPVGVSMSHLQKNNSKGTNSNWSPFSPLFDASKNVQNHLNECAAPKKNTFVNKSSGPRIYFDDITDDVFVGVSESTDSSDLKCDSLKKNNLKRMKKGLELGFKERIQVLALMALNVRNGSVKNLKQRIPLQEGVGVLTVPVVEINKKVMGNNPIRQTGRVAKELGKLDLNVEFNNNEVEEPARRMTTGTRGHGHGHGEEDNIEGIGFFEGLDEFFSSLPILSVVKEEKGMAA